MWNPGFVHARHTRSKRRKPARAGVVAGLSVAAVIALALICRSVWRRLNPADASVYVSVSWHSGPKPPVSLEDSDRMQAVQAAMRHAWHGYERYAWGKDELRPDSKTGKTGVLGGMNGFTGLGASVVDAMSTLYIMGLHEEFGRAHAWVADNMTFDPPDAKLTSFFETTIRVLGGLLAAHDLTGHRMFLDKAEDLGMRLLPAFDGTRTGILSNSAELPWTHSNPWGGGVLMAECGTNLIEYGTLAERTGNATYRRKAEAGMRFLHAKYPDQPLLGVSVERQYGDIQDGKRTVGAPVDSYFEYLLKYWILRGKRDDHWRDRWVNATDEALELLVVRPRGADFTFIGELEEGGSDLTPIISHLGCFWPGNVALGVMSGAVSGAKAEAYLDFAGSMMTACYQLYNSTKSGLGADEAEVDMRTGRVTPSHMEYLQRPEVVESLFYMWRATHKLRYRHWGWTILQAIERHCRTSAGYSGSEDVDDLPIHTDDTQQSWFLAETLKYLFLLFSDDAMLPLDQWVFNTEAHPVRALQPEDQPPPWVDWGWLRARAAPDGPDSR